MGSIWTGIGGSQGTDRIPATDTIPFLVLTNSLDPVLPFPTPFHPVLTYLCSKCVQECLNRECLNLCLCVAHEIGTNTAAYIYFQFALTMPPAGSNSDPPSPPPLILSKNFPRMFPPPTDWALEIADMSKAICLCPCAIAA